MTGLDQFSAITLEQMQTSESFLGCLGYFGKILITKTWYQMAKRFMA